MIPFEKFDKYLTALKDQEDMISNIYDVTDGRLDLAEYPDLSGCLIELLMYEVGDDEDMLPYWCYEKQYGTTFKLGDWVVNDVPIDIRTSKKLYDYFAKKHK